MGQRCARERCRQRRVDHRDRPAQRPDLVEVDDVDARIGRRLGDHEHRATRTDGLGERSGPGAVDEGDVDPEARTHTRQQLHRAAVELLLGDDVVAGRAQAEHHRRHRAHSRRKGASGLGPLEVGDGLLERCHGRVAVAAVEARGLRAVRHPAALVERRHHERGGRHQRRSERRVVGVASGRDGSGLGLFGHDRSSQPARTRSRKRSAPSRPTRTHDGTTGDLRPCLPGRSRGDDRCTVVGRESSGAARHGTG